MKKLLLLTLILAIVSVTLVKTADVDAEDAKYEFYIPTNYYIETDDVMKVERLGTFDIESPQQPRQKAAPRWQPETISPSPYAACRLPTVFLKNPLLK